MNNPVIDRYGDQRWYNIDGLIHREDGPALIRAIGTQNWYKYGKIHREDGPAVIFTDNTKWWYINGKPYYNNKSYQEAAKLSDEDMNFVILKYGDVK